MYRLSTGMEMTGGGNFRGQYYNNNCFDTVPVSDQISWCKSANQLPLSERFICRPTYIVLYRVVVAKCIQVHFDTDYVVFNSCKVHVCFYLPTDQVSCSPVNYEVHLTNVTLLI